MTDRWMKDHTDDEPPWWQTIWWKTTLMTDHLMKDHPNDEPPWWQTVWWKTTLMTDHLMKDHPDDRPPWWQTIWWKTTLMTDHLMKDHADDRPSEERPPWWQTTLMTDHLKKDHPDDRPSDERPPWWQTIWWQTSLITEHPCFWTTFSKTIHTRKSHSFPSLVRTSGGRLPSDPAGSAARFLLSEHSRNRHLIDHAALSGFVHSVILNVGCELVRKETHCNYAGGVGGCLGHFLDIAETLLCILITQSAVSYPQSQVWKTRTLCACPHIWAWTALSLACSIFDCFSETFPSYFRV